MGPLTAIRLTGSSPRTGAPGRVPWYPTQAKKRLEWDTTALDQEIRGYGAPALVSERELMRLSS